MTIYAIPSSFTGFNVIDEIVHCMHITESTIIIVIIVIPTFFYFRSKRIVPIPRIVISIYVGVIIRSKIMAIIYTLIPTIVITPIIIITAGIRSCSEAEAHGVKIDCQASHQEQS